MITLLQLRKIMPQSNAWALNYLPEINKTLDEFVINSPLRIAAFLAQIAHESGQLHNVEENLNYSALALSLTWPNRFADDGKPNDLARSLHRKPEAIANVVYADRMGNGDTASGDGWTYRGSGLIQVTGKANQDQCAAYFGIVKRNGYPWLRTSEGATRSAGWFWKTHGCNALADADNFDAISDIINIGHITARVGDSNGYAERLKFYKIAKGVICAGS